MAKGSQVLDLLHRYHHSKLLGEMNEYETQAKAERRFRPETGLKPTRPLSFLTALRGVIQKDIRGMFKKQGREPQPIGQTPSTRLPGGEQFRMRQKPATVSSTAAGIASGANVGVEKNNLIRQISALSSSSKKTDKYGYRSPDTQAIEKMMRGAGESGVSYLSGVISRAGRIARRSQEKVPTRPVRDYIKRKSWEDAEDTEQTGLMPISPAPTGSTVKVVRMFDPNKLLGNDGAKKLPSKTRKELPPGSK
jgi:hypothetical protein